LFLARGVAEATDFFLALFVIARLVVLETAIKPLHRPVGRSGPARNSPLNSRKRLSTIRRDHGSPDRPRCYFSGIERTPQQVAVQQGASHTYEAYLRSENLGVVKTLFWSSGAFALDMGDAHTAHEIFRRFQQRGTKNEVWCSRAPARSLPVSSFPFRGGCPILLRRTRKLEKWMITQHRCPGVRAFNPKRLPGYFLPGTLAHGFRKVGRFASHG